MKMLAAWVTLVLTGILTLGSLLVLIDLVSTKIANGSVYVYADMAIALILFSGSAYVASRSFRRIHSQPR
jgi:amino acid transporter